MGVYEGVLRSHFLSSRKGEATMKKEEGGKGGDGAAKGKQAFEK
jgi:hypothetical protein